MNSDSSSFSALVYPELKTTHHLDCTTNFQTWRSKLDFVLADNNVAYVFPTQNPQPPTPHHLHQKWLRDDFTARHIILGALHKHVQMSYNRHETTKSLKDPLSAFFTRPSMAKRMVKLRQYVDHKMHEGKSVNQDILEMGSMAYELECEGLKVHRINTPQCAQGFGSA